MSNEIGLFPPGKSQVSEIFRQLGVDIVDTDLIAREVVQPGGNTLDRVGQRPGGCVEHPRRDLAGVGDDAAQAHPREDEHVVALPDDVAAPAELDRVEGAARGDDGSARVYHAAGGDG